MRTILVREEAGRKLADAIRTLENKGVKVGWIDGSKYPDGKISVAMIAAQNEFGNPNKNIPARPFMRPTIQAEESNWIKLSQDGAKKVLRNEITMDAVLNLIGSQAEADIKKTISKLYYPALAETTVLNRIRRNQKLNNISGRLTEKNIGNISKPLIDTGIMFNTITHELTDE
jgi:hypothetical protein